MREITLKEMKYNINLIIENTANTRDYLISNDIRKSIYSDIKGKYIYLSIIKGQYKTQSIIRPNDELCKLKIGLIKERENNMSKLYSIHAIFKSHSNNFGVEEFEDINIASAEIEKETEKMIILNKNNTTKNFENKIRISKDLFLDKVICRHGFWYILTTDINKFEDYIFILSENIKKSYNNRIIKARNEIDISNKTIDKIRELVGFKNED